LLRSVARYRPCRAFSAMMLVTSAIIKRLVGPG
jgi:hypothetical protein